MGVWSKRLNVRDSRNVSMLDGCIAAVIMH